MQILIPMSGEGSRFKAAGYDILKPLIPVSGKPIIEHVIDLFPGEHDFTFVTREDHAEQYGFKEYFQKLCPGSCLVTIGAPYPKFGPVFAAMKAAEYIKNDEPVLLSYCDYFMNWDFNDFCKDVLANGDDGNVICYSGFHPHLLHEKNVYAGCRVNEKMELLEIKEKFSFEEDKTKGYHSVGAYYFRTGALMKHYFRKTIERDLSLNGEYYASLVFNLLVEDHLNVRVYDKVPHFCQWGTPSDLQEYQYWESIFKEHHYA